MQTIRDRADFPIGTAVSGRNTADLSGINGPFTEYDALMLERGALICHRQMLERKKTELEQVLQKQRSEKEACPALFVFPSAEDLSKTTRPGQLRGRFNTQGIAHQCVHNSAVLSSWSTPIGSGVGARGMREYQKSFHAHNLTRTLRHTEKLSLCSADQDAVMHTLTTVQTAPMVRRLELDTLELTEPMVQFIYQLEREGRLEYFTIRLHRITPAMQLLSKLSSLRSLDLSNTIITNEDLRGLQGCQNLIKLDLSSCPGVADLSLISCFRTLEVFKVSGRRRLFGCGTLGKLPTLKEFHLSETRITDEEIRQLSESNTLVKIYLKSCEALTNVNPLSSIATLEVIDLSGCSSLTHVGALGMLPALKVIDLSNTRITDEGVRRLSESKSLVKVDLRCCRTLINVNPLSSIATLGDIYLSWCTSLTNVGALGKFPVVIEVDLSFTRITDEDVRQLSECKSLVKIDLKSCEALTNVNPLSSITTLEVINLSCCTSLIHMGELGKLPALKEVDLSFTRIMNEEIRQLSESNTLVKIVLNSCRALTNVNPLSSIATLEVINLLHCTSLTHVGALGKLLVLNEVDLSRTPITDEEIIQLSESNTLVKIDLSYCKELTNVNPLSSIETLEVINLSGCTSLTHVGALGKLLVLNEVDLSRTPITDEEIIQLSESNTLVKIDLSYCKELTNVNPLSSIETLEVINLSGCTSLIRMGLLIKLPFLKEVDLSKIGLIDAGVNVLTSLRKQLGLLSIDIRI